MFEGLIEFIESTVFGLINQIASQDKDGLRQLRAPSRCCSASPRRTPA